MQKHDGWWADDGNYPVYYENAASAEEAMQRYADDGDWWPVTKSFTLNLHAWQDEDDDGDPIDPVGGSIVIDPPEPACQDGEHDWQSPHHIVGGLEENPGVQGHGGGVVMTEVCARCGMYRVTDTWDTDSYGCPYTSIEYRDADEKSREWARRNSLPVCTRTSEWVECLDERTAYSSTYYALGQDDDGDDVVLMWGHFGLDDTYTAIWGVDDDYTPDMGHPSMPSGAYDCVVEEQ